MVQDFFHRADAIVCISIMAEMPPRILGCTAKAPFAQWGNFRLSCLKFVRMIRKCWQIYIYTITHPEDSEPCCNAHFSQYFTHKTTIGLVFQVSGYFIIGVWQSCFGLAHYFVWSMILFRFSVGPLTAPLFFQPQDGNDVVSIKATNATNVNTPNVGNDIWCIWYHFPRPFQVIHLAFDLHGQAGFPNDLLEVWEKMQSWRNNHFSKRQPFELFLVDPIF